jgi:DNA-binding GntR family transcriptional regulator
MKKLIIKPGKTIRQKVYEYLRESILSGEIHPGERIVESDIASRIGTSRTPVREALHSLEREGLLESTPRIGYAVTTISESEVSELSGIRLALEDLALRWALEKDSGELMAGLRENVQRSQKLLEVGEVKAFIELDAQFHEIISKIADSKQLTEMTQSIRRHMLRYRIQSIYTAENVARAIAGHKAVLDAIADGDTRKAQKALQDHIEQSRKDILFFGFKSDAKKNISGD